MTTATTVAIDDMLREIKGKRRTVQVIDREQHLGTWWVRLALIGTYNHRWWISESSLLRRYEPIAQSEDATA